MGLWESKNHTTWISLGLQLLTWRQFSKVLAMKQKPESPPWLPPGYSGLVTINKGLGQGFFVMRRMMCRQTWGLGACFLWWSWLRVETPDVLKVTPKAAIKSCAVRKSKKSTECRQCNHCFSTISGDVYSPSSLSLGNFHSASSPPLGDALWWFLLSMNLSHQSHQSDTSWC